MYELATAFEQDGYTPEMLKSLVSGGRLRALKGVLEGNAQIVSISTVATEKKVEPKSFIIKHGHFNPAEFIGAGWSIIAEETDVSSIALTELDLNKVQQVTMLKDGETHIKGEEKLKRLKESKNIRLDADIFLALWENQYLIPESWKEKVGGNTRYIFFDGTVLRSSDGRRYVLYLCWDGGAWYWYVRWLGIDWNAGGPSAVLVS